MKNLTLTQDWEVIKRLYDRKMKQREDKTKPLVLNGGGEMDILCNKLIERLGGLTQIHGFDHTIENIHLDQWKSRVWGMIDNAGLLI